MKAVSLLLAVALLVFQQHWLVVMLDAKSPSLNLVTIWGAG
jgi:hypothetical protein